MVSMGSRNVGSDVPGSNLEKDCVVVQLKSLAVYEEELSHVEKP